MTNSTTWLKIRTAQLNPVEMLCSFWNHTRKVPDFSIRITSKRNKAITTQRLEQSDRARFLANALFLELFVPDDILFLFH